MNVCMHACMHECMYMWDGDTRTYHGGEHGLGPRLLHSLVVIAVGIVWYFVSFGFGRLVSLGEHTCVLWTHKRRLNRKQGRARCFPKHILHNKTQDAPDVVVAAVLLPVRADDVLNLHQGLAPVGYICIYIPWFETRWMGGC